MTPRPASARPAHARTSAALSRARVALWTGGFAVAAGAVFLATLTATRAGAVLPPAAYEEARHVAVHHIQMRIDAVEPLPWNLETGPCGVTGEVVRVFMGDHAVGDTLSFAIDCAKPRASLGAGPQLWTAWRAIEEAGYVEAYLDTEGAVAGWQTVLLSEPSDEPACPLDTVGSC